MEFSNDPRAPSNRRPPAGAGRPECGGVRVRVAGPRLRLFKCRLVPWVTEFHEVVHGFSHPARLFGIGTSCDGLQHYDGLIVGRLDISAKAAQGRRELGSECFDGAGIQLTRDLYQPITTEFLSSRIDGFGHAVGVQHHEVTYLRLYDYPVVADVGEQA